MDIRPVRVSEGSLGVITVYVDRIENGVRVPENLVGKGLRLTVKSRRDDADSDAVAVIIGSVDDPAIGKGSFQLVSAATETAGEYFYKLEETSGPAAVAAAMGPFIVANS